MKRSFSIWNVIGVVLAALAGLVAVLGALVLAAIGATALLAWRLLGGRRQRPAVPTHGEVIDIEAREVVVPPR